MWIHVGIKQVIWSSSQVYIIMTVPGYSFCLCPWSCVSFFYQFFVIFFKVSVHVRACYDHDVDVMKEILEA